MSIYSQELLDSMKNVEDTREYRMTEKLPILTIDERRKLLKQFHPDFNPASLRELKVGPNKGEKIYNEYADLFETYSVLDLNEIDLTRIDFDVDVLVVGGGGAGTSAALLAQENGANVLLSTKLRLGDANTMMAQGGIQAADKDNDSPIYIKICIDGINYSMRAENILDRNFTDGKIYWYSTKLKSGNHIYQFFASDGEIQCSTNISNLKVNFGPLTRIIIEPSSPIINLNEFQIFNATGFDADNNILSISPYWDVNEGGRIDQFGNFTPLLPGKWTIFAYFGNVSGNTTITVVDLIDENVTNNKSKDKLDNDTDNDFIPDEWEKEHNFNISDPSDAFLDSDMDNLTNLEEYLNNTNPKNPDSDLDGLSDGDEVKIYLTNPLDSDTDYDNYNDGLEIDKNTDPLDDEDYPIDEDKEKESKKFEIGIYLLLIEIIIIILFLLSLYIKQRNKKDKE